MQQTNKTSIYITEALGTAMISLVYGLSGDPLAIAAVFISQILLFHSYSGAHFNPLITLSQIVHQKIDNRLGIGYIIVQVLGALIGGLLVITLRPNVAAPIVSEGHLVTIFIQELIASCLLVLTYFLLRAEAVKLAIAVGMLYLAFSFCFGAMSGALFNPALLLSGNLIEIISWKHTGWYLLGQVGGGSLAWLIFSGMQSISLTDGEK